MSFKMNNIFKVYRKTLARYPLGIQAVQAGEFQYSPFLSHKHTFYLLKLTIKVLLYLS